MWTNHSTEGGYRFLINLRLPILSCLATSIVRTDTNPAFLNTGYRSKGW